ncbi:MULTISPECIES: hypothetical protein [unclassified Rhodococcus (in: high G+C Gram-positive bacteria)]|uniref:hypothetical protein n=1 Tax=unclassified Rhodococcus (in: high G+C Gram-positive bacteria) TaxID=192944 RepID=UPI000495B754|nr:hypothetical protein [Rhodococcus sp. DK17]
MRAASKLDVEDLRWAWVATSAAVGLLGVRVVPALYLLFIASLIGFTGLIMFGIDNHRTTGARLASISFGLLIPVCTTLVLQGVNSL